MNPRLIDPQTLLNSSTASLIKLSSNTTSLLVSKARRPGSGNGEEITGHTVPSGGRVPEIKYSLMRDCVQTEGPLMEQCCSISDQYPCKGGGK